MTFMNTIQDPNFEEPQSNFSMPMVVEQDGNGYRSYDLPSRMMESRILMLDRDFNSQMAHIMKQQLLYLDSLNADPITIYINSPGGSVHDGLGIADVVGNLRSPIRTVVVGMAASMGCYMQSTMGTPGMRFMGKRSQIMAHQVSSGTQGLILDQKIALEHSLNLNKLLTEEIAEAVGMPIEQFLKDCDRDMWLNAEEALNYGTKGFVDGVYLGKQDANGKQLVLRRGGVEEWV